MDLHKTWSSTTRTKISTGNDFPSRNDPHKFSLCRPFSSQLNLVFPSDDNILAALSSLKYRYLEGTGTLFEIVKNYPFGMGVSILPDTQGHHEDDTWCIDHRGVLTLFLSKTTYEQLGVVGEKLPFKASVPRFIIRFSLANNVDSVKNRARRGEALKKFDQLIGRAWKVLVNAHDLPNLNTMSLGLQGVVFHDVKCSTHLLENVYVPRPNIKPLSSCKSPDEVEDWNVEMSALFEWTGMAALGAQRLSCNDRVDPYICLYEPPENSKPGNVTHMTYQGFLGPQFLRAVFEIVLNRTSFPKLPLFSLVGHSYLSSPVTYIKPFDANLGSTNATVRDPFGGFGQEDTWSILLSRHQDEATSKWAFVDSIGSHDTRFG